MSPSNPYLTKLVQVEKEISEKRFSTIEHIKRIPHLPCQLDFDPQLAWQEIEQINEWKPHKLHNNKNFNPSYLLHHEFSFKGVCIFDYQSKSEIGMLDPKGFLYEQSEAKFDEFGRQQFFVTDVGAKTPYILSIIKKISPFPNRTRIIKTPPGGGIPWHSHHNNIYKINYLRLCIFNLPVITNPTCIHRVRDHRDQTSQIYSQHYKAGSTYLFNSWHDHQFWNESKTTRYTIIPYFNFTDEILLNFLNQQIQNYTGPLIKV